MALSPICQWCGGKKSLLLKAGEEVKTQIKIYLLPSVQLLLLNARGKLIKITYVEEKSARQEGNKAGIERASGSGIYRKENQAAEWQGFRYICAD